MFGKSSTEPNFKLHLLQLEMQALYKRRENLCFAVVNRATTTSETPPGLQLFIYFHWVIVLVAVVVLPSYMLKLPDHLKPRSKLG
jgi:hypothetical protein